jgi:hypothetical protein
MFRSTKLGANTASKTPTYYSQRRITSITVDYIANAFTILSDSSKHNMELDAGRMIYTALLLHKARLAQEASGV